MVAVTTLVFNPPNSTSSHLAGAPQTPSRPREGLVGTLHPQRTECVAIRSPFLSGASAVAHDVAYLSLVNTAEEFKAWISCGNRRVDLTRMARLTLIAGVIGCGPGLAVVISNPLVLWTDGAILVAAKYGNHTFNCGRAAYDPVEETLQTVIGTQEGHVLILQRSNALQRAEREETQCDVIMVIEDSCCINDVATHREPGALRQLMLAVRDDMRAVCMWLDDSAISDFNNDKVAENFPFTTFEAQPLSDRGFFTYIDISEDGRLAAATNDVDHYVMVWRVSFEDCDTEAFVPCHGVLRRPAAKLTQLWRVDSPKAGPEAPVGRFDDLSPYKIKALGDHRFAFIAGPVLTLLDVRQREYQVFTVGQSKLLGLDVTRDGKQMVVSDSAQHYVLDLLAPLTLREHAMRFVNANAADVVVTAEDCRAVAVCVRPEDGDNCCKLGHQLRRVAVGSGWALPGDIIACATCDRVSQHGYQWWCAQCNLVACEQCDRGFPCTPLALHQRLSADELD
jgi:hypothetical protein